VQIFQDKEWSYLRIMLILQRFIWLNPLNDISINNI
jgi:hypothetical protein